MIVDAAKTQISHRAVVQRINRHYAKSGKVLRASRTPADRARGSFYVADLTLHRVDSWVSCPLAVLAAELGVLHPYESVTD